MIDGLGRKIEYLRLSVTDKCNLCCSYCMPEGGIKHLKHEEVLTFEETELILRVMADLGIKKLRFTGGEPLVKRGILDLINRAGQIEGIEELVITTNGVLLEKSLEELKRAGIKRVNLSIDTLNREKYKKITGSDCLETVLSGMKAALEAGIQVKINSVLAPEIDKSDICELIKLAYEYPVDVRFIELMPIGEKGRSEAIREHLGEKEVYQLIAEEFGIIDNSINKNIYNNKSAGPAKMYRLKGAVGRAGIITPMSHAFCSECNRVRLTADGFLKLCLGHETGIDLKKLIRENIAEHSEKQTEANLIEKKQTEAIHTEDKQIEKVLKEAILTAIQKKPVSHVFKGSENSSEKPADDEENSKLRDMVRVGG